MHLIGSRLGAVGSRPIGGAQFVCFTADPHRRSPSPCGGGCGFGLTQEEPYPGFTFVLQSHFDCWFDLTKARIVGVMAGEKKKKNAIRRCATLFVIFLASYLIFLFFSIPQQKRIEDKTQANTYATASHVFRSYCG